MIFFGHLGFSSMGTYLTRKVSTSQRSFQHSFRWRYILLFSILPDIIDKPLQFIIPAFEVGRSIGHSILGLCILWGIITWKKLSPYYVLSYLVHFICDQQWEHLPSLLWPLWGVHIYPPEILTRAEYWQKVFSPIHLLFELVGIAFLVYIFRIQREKL